MAFHSLPLLDAAVLDDLEEVLGTAFADMAAELCAVLETSSAECARQHAMGDFEALARTAHRLRGGAGTIGAGRLARVADELEAAAGAQLRQRVDTLIHLMGTITDDTVLALHRRLKV